MRIEAILWTGKAVFFAVLGAVYLLLGGEAAGGALLILGTGFGALVAGWLWRATRSHHPRAEDRADADMADEAGEIGTFVTASIQPFLLGLAMTMVVLGLVIGIWLTAIGVALGASTALAMVREAP